MRSFDSQSAIEKRLFQRLLDGSNNNTRALDVSSGVFIYGAGELGMLAIEYCEACEILILGILDQNKSGLIKGKFSEYLISKPEEIPMEERSEALIAIAIATVAFSQISEILKSYGWRNILPFYSLSRKKRAGHPLNNGWEVGLISKDEMEKVLWICGNWDDKASLLHYEAFLAWHIDETELTLVDLLVDSNKRYAIAPLLEVLNNKHQLMVDVGSHRGESVKRLVDLGIIFSEYVLIEPDAASRERLKKSVLNWLPVDKKIDFLNIVLGAENTLRPFKEGLGYCSQLWTNSVNFRSIVTLDSLECRPDFIKIHTEGSELNVLLGSIKTIAEYKPTLAFSVYHNRDGFCRTIFESMQLFGGYKWYFRLHSYQGTGAFIYGIPI
jgi:FkbM family methyltransferase